MFHFRRVYILVMVFVGVVAFISTVPVQGDDDPASSDTSVYNGDALLLDAQQYATYFNVDPSEALRRLKLQDAIGLLGTRLSEQEQDTFAGLWLEHEPQFRVIVRFTQEGEQRVSPYIQNGPLADIVETRPASVTLADLQAIQTATQSTVRDLGVPLDYDINIFENQVELYVIDPVQFNEALQGANLQLPEHVVVIQVDSLSRKTTNIYGGLSLTPVCTSGFSVKNIYGTMVGVVTAGHCGELSNNPLYYGTYELPLQDQMWDGPYDVQWHTVPGLTIQNWVWDGFFNRYIYGQRHRNYQFVGDFVCKFGKTTGGECGTITSKTFNGTYIRVHNDSVDLAEPGDSGGPWFSGTSAFGIMTGDIEPSNDAYYMAINYIDILGINVYTGGPLGCPLNAAPMAYTWDALGDGNGRIKITWSGFDDSSLDRFDIYRNTTPNTNNWTLVHAYEEATSGEWIDTGVSNGVVYYYWLNIFDCYGEVTSDGPQSTTTGYSPGSCGCGGTEAICPDVICPDN